MTLVWYRGPKGGTLDVAELRADWMALVAGVQAARSRSNAMQSARVLEEMLPFVRKGPSPVAAQSSPAWAAQPASPTALPGVEHRQQFDGTAHACHVLGKAPLVTLG